MVSTVNLGIWKTNDPRVTYLNGLLLFIGGLCDRARAQRVGLPAAGPGRSREEQPSDEGTSALQGS